MKNEISFERLISSLGTILLFVLKEPPHQLNSIAAIASERGEFQPRPTEISE